MISKQRLLTLVYPVQVSPSEVVFPTQLALMITDYHNSHLPHSGVIFNPIVLEGLTSDNLDKYVGFGTSQSVATELKSVYDKDHLPSVMDLTALSVAQVYTSSVSEMAIARLTKSLINTPPAYWAPRKSSAVTFGAEQVEALTAAGIPNLVCEGPDQSPGVWRAAETVVVQFQARLGVGYPGQTPADQALNPWLASGTIKVAQTGLAVALSPILHILTPSRELLSIPAALICDVHFGTPDFANMDDLPLEHPYLAKLQMSYSLNSHWRDTPVVGVSNNDDVATAIMLNEPYCPTIGGRPHWEVDRTVVCEQISVTVPRGQMIESEKFAVPKVTSPLSARVTIGLRES